MKFVCLWSGPRNVSTALMYSFAQRHDTAVIDEPLYAHYLRVSGAHHPGREEILAAMDTDGDAVMQRILGAPYDDAVELVFMKQMAHHLLQLDRRVLLDTEHVLLIRDPREMLPSLTIQLPEATLPDTGLPAQWELYRELEAGGRPPAVLDARELLLDPERVLTVLCTHLGVPFTRDMLAWPAGARPEDGIWAPYWYHAVHQSTGFAAHTPKTSFPDALRPLLSECVPYYDQLVAHAIRA